LESEQIAGNKIVSAAPEDGVKSAEIRANDNAAAFASIALLIGARIACLPITNSAGHWPATP
jgi:hypothetical protein